LTKELTIEKIAEEMHISPSQVSRIFKRATGKSPHSYITTKRLLLFNKKKRAGTGVIDACHECGFRDYSAFYRLYKKHFNKAPTE
jgi:AraC-like DNA-binding protein